jgi:glutamate synthase (NADPH) small chain
MTASRVNIAPGGLPASADGAVIVPLHQDHPNASGLATSAQKYAWHSLSREEPPKRDAKERQADFREIYQLFDLETVKAQAARCIQCAMPFCRLGCPLSSRIPEWLALVAEGRFLEAAEISQETSSMPEICARVCPQERLCEGACLLLERAEPVPIGAIEKFINEFAFEHGGATAARVMPNGKSVAVVGSGPAGISCADALAKLGYAVTVFEAKPRAGGLLVNGIPSFKLQKEVVDRRLDLLMRRGIIFRHHTTIGQDLPLAKLLEEYDAVFLGRGAQHARKLDVPGGNLKGSCLALDFLIAQNLGPASNYPSVPIEGRQVVVLGGGDTAMDCLRTAIRGGARKATCVYRRNETHLPASHREYRNALEEGAEFLFMATPLELVGNPQGEVTQIRLARTEFGEPDAQGLRQPHAVPGSDFFIPAEVVLVAFGLDPTPFPDSPEWLDIQVNELGGVAVDENQMTSVPKVFAGGAQVNGANLVVYAVRDGYRAAAGIHRYLSGKA